MATTIIVLRLNGDEYKVDVDPAGFTAGELNGIERNTGMQWQEWLERLADKRVSSLAWTGLAWLAMRRAGNFMPWDEFEDTVKVMELVGSVNPEDAAPAAAAVKSPPRKR